MTCEPSELGATAQSVGKKDKMLPTNLADRMLDLKIHLLQNTGQVEVHYENARRDTLELQDENRTFTIRLQMRT